jgi:hypothetical protein
MANHRSLKDRVIGLYDFVEDGVMAIGRLYHPRTMREKGIAWTVSLLLVTQLIIILLLGWYWTKEPDEFNVKHVILLDNGQAFTPERLATGQVFTNTLIHIADTLLHKRGGYISNDKLLPGIYLDNMPSWEEGALEALRDASSALRNHFARSQSQSMENPELAQSVPHFNYRRDSWILPSTESEYQQGIDHMRKYMAALVDPEGKNAHFYPRADNLSQYLQVVEKRLGSLSHRLSASSIHTHMHVMDESLRQKLDVERTPWLRIDNVFYEARGAAWALSHILRAIEHDFQDVLQKKNAVVPLHQIVHELEDALFPVLSPVVLNGDGYGIFANYSLTTANHIARATAATLDLKDLLTRG